jgi:FSR family fosmidomycin resistance protein-like MFS transporter
VARARTAGRADDWRGFGRLTTVVVPRSVAYFGVASLVALFAIRHFHEPTAVGSATLVTFTGAGVIGTLGGGWLAGRWRRVGVLRLGYGVSALALALLVAAPAIAVLFVAAFVLGIVLFAPFVVQVTLGQDSCRTGSAWQAASPWAWPSRSAGWPPRCSGCSLIAAG